MIMSRALILAAAISIGTGAMGTGSPAGVQTEEPTTPVPYSLGSADAYWQRPLAERAFIFRNMDELTSYPIHPIRHGAHPSPLPEGKAVDVHVTIDGKPTSLSDFMADNHAAAMLIIRHGQVVFEQYRMGNTPRSRWVMFSVTKSVTSTLVGAALRDGAIHDIDDPIVRYLPALKGSAWDGVTIRQTLRMSSGVDIHDVYEGPAPTGLNASFEDPAPDAPLRYLATLKRSSPPGRHFSYSGANTYILGRVVMAATGKSLSAYLSEKIWVPMGMEDDAYWRTDSDGREIAQSGLSATLRDMGRFGLLALHGGMIEGKRIVPDTWFDQATSTTDEPLLAPSAIKEFEPMGYGYQWWTAPRGGSSYQIGDDGAFVAIGIYGQQVYVVPKQDEVVVIQSATPAPVSMGAVIHAQAVIAALVRQP